jgi:hypothetical protein
MAGPPASKDGAAGMGECPRTTKRGKGPSRGVRLTFRHGQVSRKPVPLIQQQFPGTGKVILW